MVRRLIAIVLMSAPLNACQGLKRFMEGRPVDDITIPSVPAATSADPMELPPVRVMGHGQSNDTLGGEIAYAPSGLVWANRSYYYDLALIHLSEAVGIHHSSPFIQALDKLARHLNRRMEFINTGLGGTSLYYLSVGEHSGPFWQAVAEFKPDVICWTQGEADAATTKENYYAMVKDMMDRVRALSPKTKWIIALDGWKPRGQGDVRGAQEQLIADGLAFQGPDIDEMRSHGDLWTKDEKLHIAAPAGYEELGRRWYEAISAHIDLP